ncbi:chromate efflux transporter [bacterium]|nr:chromate efflux transporter [bacterium]
MADFRAFPTFREAFLFWLKLGFISFGGPAGQIAIMHEELVERRKWISEERFLHALNYCMVLPGPEAQQLAIYIGWLLHRTWGGIVAGSLFVIPSFFILTGLSWTYMAYGSLPAVSALFYGLKAAVLAIVASAAIRIGRKAIRNSVLAAVAVAAFVGIQFFHVAFPVIIISAGVLGLAGGKEHGGGTSGLISDDQPAPEHTRPTPARTLAVLAVCLSLWIGALAALGLWRGTGDVFHDQGKFFSKAAMVTFGGAYAVLPYIAQAGVETYGWLKPDQMIDGLGLAETTPGPLIMVVTFVGYVGGWTKAAGLPPECAGFLGGLVATYFTFLPCFLWIFLGAPYIEQTRGNLRLAAALSTITAAVVGVILNLAVYFGAHVLFPGPGRFDWAAAVIAGAAFAGLWKFKWNVVWVILGSAAAGWGAGLF